MVAVHLSVFLAVAGCRGGGQVRAQMTEDMVNIKMLGISVPGVPGEDFPILATVPDTSFRWVRGSPQYLEPRGVQLRGQAAGPQLRGRGGLLPGVPHLHRGPRHQQPQVQPAVPQRHDLRPARADLPLVVPGQLPGRRAAVHRAAGQHGGAAVPWGLQRHLRLRQRGRLQLRVQ